MNRATVQLSNGIIVGSAVGLLILNLRAFSIASLVLSIALLLVIIIYLRVLRADSVGIYAFLLAEVSPISLNASLGTVLAYQALCLMLLVTILSSSNQWNGLRAYKKAALRTTSLVVMLLALYALLLRTKPLNLSSNQLLFISTAVLLLLLYVLLFAARTRTGFTKEVTD